MRNMYVDLDDTFVETEQYCRRVLSSNYIKVPLNETVYVMYGEGRERQIFNEIFRNYSVIPLKDGARECMKLLETEYNIIFCSAYTTTVEAAAKEKLAKFLGKDIILCETNEKSHVEMGSGIFVEDNPRHLVCSKCEVANQYLMYSPFTLDDEGVPYFNRFKGTTVFNWYELVDKLMGGEEDVELRKYIRERIQKFSQGDRL